MIRLAGVDVHLIIFYSNILSLFFLAPMVFAKVRRGKLPRGKALYKFLVLGPITLLNTFTFLYALKNTTISNALMTHYIAPVVVAVLAAVFLKERFTLRVFGAIVLASVGLLILLGMDPSEIAYVWRLRDGNSLGIFSGLVSGVSYAMLIVMVRVLAPHEDVVVLVFFQNLMMCVLLLPFVREFPIHALWSFVFIGVLHSTLAPLLYVHGLKTLRANSAAILGYLEPVCAILFGVVILGEIPGRQSYVGGALILFSGYLAMRGQQADAPPP